MTDNIITSYKIDRHNFFQKPYFNGRVPTFVSLTAIVLVVMACMYRYVPRIPESKVSVSAKPLSSCSRSTIAIGGVGGREGGRGREGRREGNKHIFNFLTPCVGELNVSLILSLPPCVGGLSQILPPLPPTHSFCSLRENDVEVGDETYLHDLQPPGGISGSLWPPEPSVGNCPLEREERYRIR